MFKFLLGVLATSAAAFQLSTIRKVNSLLMGLDPVLSKSFPRDFKTIPIGTDYGVDLDNKLNKEVENRRLDYLEKDLFAVLKDAINTKQRPMFTTALIAVICIYLILLEATFILVTLLIGRLRYSRCNS